MFNDSGEWENVKFDLSLFVESSLQFGKLLGDAFPQGHFYLVSRMDVVQTELCLIFGSG